MSVEIMIGPVIVVVGILLLIFRWPFLRLCRWGLTKFYGPGIGEESTDPRVVGPAMIIVPIVFIIFGCYVFVEALLF